MLQCGPPSASFERVNLQETIGRISKVLFAFDSPIVEMACRPFDYDTLRRCRLGAVEMSTCQRPRRRIMIKMSFKKSVKFYSSVIRRRCATFIS